MGRNETAAIHARLDALEAEVFDGITEPAGDIPPTVAELERLTRAELDAELVRIGHDPADYGNKAEAAEAIVDSL